MKDYPQTKMAFAPECIDHQKFVKLVQHWIDTLDLEKFIHSEGFKYFPTFIEKIDRSLTKEIVVYTLTKRFKHIFVSTNLDLLFNGSQSIKQSYAKISIEHFMGKDAYFDYFCIYLTKIASQFLAHHFMNLQIDRQLQSQIYIVIVFVMIGLQISAKSYSLNLNKVIYNANKYKRIKIDKLDSIDSCVSKSSSKRGRKGFKKINVNRLATFQLTKNLDDMDEFKQNLRKNLNVQVFPKLMKRKIKFLQYDHMINHSDCQEPKQSLCSSPKLYLNSNQNSSSFNLTFTKDRENKCYNHKNVKIIHRPLVIIGKNTRIVENPSLIPNDPLVSNCSEQEDENNKNNWNSIIKNIKHKGSETKKLLHTHFTTSSIIDYYPINQDRVEKNEKPSQQSHQQPMNQQLTEVTAYVRQQQKRKIATYWIEDKETIRLAQKNTSQSSHQKIKSHQLRRERGRFDHSCEQRSLKSHYSMFNINSAVLNRL